MLPKPDARQLLVAGNTFSKCDTHENLFCFLITTSQAESMYYENTDPKRREEKPARCHSMVYCTYNMLNMFRALLCPSSGARDYVCVIIAYGVQCLVAGCRGSGVGQQAMRPGRGMLHDVSCTHSLLSST